MKIEHKFKLINVAVYETVQNRRFSVHKYTATGIKYKSTKSFQAHYHEQPQHIQHRIPGCNIFSLKRCLVGGGGGEGFEEGICINSIVSTISQINTCITKHTIG